MIKFMRMLVFFDLPVQSKQQRRVAARFRSFLLKEGYFMVQYSVYARICGGMDGVAVHRQRLEKNLPDNGAIRLLVLTEKQYNAIAVLVGKLSPNEVVTTTENLTVL